MTIDLRKPNLREVPVGTKVISTKGFTFELVKRDGGKESWLDVTSQLIWHDKEVWKGNHIEAMEKFGERLPTKEQFTEAEEHGFREVLPNINYWFWSSSLITENPYVAYVFNGYVGRVDVVNRSSNVDDDTARCVSSVAPAKDVEPSASMQN